MLFGRICSNWRSVAYSTPKLWSSLHIPGLSSDWVSNLPQNIDRKLEKVVAAWLDRSAASPLSISLSRDRNHFHNPPDIVDQLIGVSRRVRHLAGLHPRRVSACSSLCEYNNNQPAKFWDGVTVFSVSNLHQISLDLSTDALALPIPWSQITELSLDVWTYPSGMPTGLPGGMTQNGTHDLLRRCPNLARCRLRATWNLTFISAPTITLPHLKVLILLSHSDIVEFMRTLVLPKLRHPGVVDAGSICSLRSVESSTHALTLDLRHEGLALDSLVDLLNLFPGISRIRALRSNVTETLLDRLRPTPMGTVCPALKDLELGMCYLSDGTFLDFFARPDELRPSSAAHCSPPSEHDEYRCREGTRHVHLPGPSG
ncbi:hypothetical protein FB451DRAFT_1447209 [Mycena latifolia]|nr:hypothetical protein FB451DRAFT_1447209 [Mycena latifolia]